MNLSLIFLEVAVLILGLALLLLDLWTTQERKRWLGYGAAIGTLILFCYSLRIDASVPQLAFNGSYVLDGFALFFKRFFLLAATIVLIIAVEFSERIRSGISEYYSLVVIALAGMLFASSANDFSMLFVSIELITMSFYVLTSFQRNKLPSLEAGIKYLILGALSTAFTVYGIALVYGSAGTMSFDLIAAKSAALADKPIFLLGLLLVVVGLAFKIAAFPLQIWAPDVYQGAPAPTTAFLAVGSKAAGFVLLLRVLFHAVPGITGRWATLFIGISAVSILYGNLCAIPQRSIKRLLGYSSIAHAGYLLLGVAAMAANINNTTPGGSAILYYLGGYLFTVLAAFAVLCLILRKVDSDDITSLAGLNQRSPLLATAMTLAMVSLAGIPPMAGFFGKFLLFKAALEQGATNPAFYWLVGVALFGVVISLYYYGGIIRTIYWSSEPPDLSPLPVSIPTRLTLYLCIAGMLYLGLFPGFAVRVTTEAIAVLKKG